MPSFCLNMIVRNEVGVLARCLDSVRPWIDHWLVVDTGSVDGTQELVGQLLDGIPGSVHERPWRNFGDNRTEALELADKDPELKDWFEAEVRQDRIIADKVKQVRPPENLRDQILTGMNMAEQTPPWWRRTPVMAIAATIISSSAMKP